MSNEIFIYGEIGDSFWGEGVSENDVKDQLLTLPQDETLDVRINTVGGQTGSGLTIFNLLRSYASKQRFFNPNFKLRTIVDGFAYSAGSIIMLAGDERIMSLGSRAMIHNPWSYASGDYRDFEQVVTYLKDSRDSLGQLYADMAGKSKDDFLKLMDDETFFSPQEAVAAGLATKAEDPPTVEVNRQPYDKDTVAQFKSLNKKGQYLNAFKSVCCLKPKEKIIKQKQPSVRLTFESLLATIE